MQSLEQLKASLAQIAESGQEPLDRIAGIHKYWARKPWRIMDIFINKYSKIGDVILDPFMGSGSTGLQANLCGRKFIGIDLNPFACLLASELLSDVPVDQIIERLEALSHEVKTRVMGHYATPDGFALWRDDSDENTVKIGVVADEDFTNRRTLPINYSEPSPSRDQLTYPDSKFPPKFYKDRFSNKGVSSVADLFTTRNLSALSVIWQSITRDPSVQSNSLKLIFSNTLLHVSKLKGANIRPLGVNNYWIPSDKIEENVWWRFEDRANRFIKAKSAIKQERDRRLDSIVAFDITNGSATKLAKIATESIDYILTDPPYGDAIQYSELSFVWNTWLGLEYQNTSEVIVNPMQSKGPSEYLGLLTSSLSEARRVLKENSYLTIAFHSKDIHLWVGLATTLRELGFQLEDIAAFPPKGNPFTRNWAKFSPKTDLYVTVQKVSTSQSAEMSNTASLADIVKYVKDSIDITGMSIFAKFDLLVSVIFQRVLTGTEIVDLPSSSNFAKAIEKLDY